MGRTVGHMGIEHSSNQPSYAHEANTNANIRISSKHVQSTTAAKIDFRCCGVGNGAANNMSKQESKTKT